MEKLPDWTCENCGQVNFGSKRRDTCWKCNAAKGSKGENKKPQGQGENQDPSEVEFLRDPTRFDGLRLKDGRTGKVRSIPIKNGKISEEDMLRCLSQLGIQLERQHQQGHNASTTDHLSTDKKDASKPGDWTCQRCHKSNFARRTHCFGCGLAKGADPAPSPHYYECPRPHRDSNSDYEDPVALMTDAWHDYHYGDL